MIVALLVASMLFQVQDRGKIQGAADAPAKDRRAQIVVDEHGEDVVQIVSANSGQVLKTFQVLEDIPPDGPCVSVLQIDWPRTDTITAECHQNPTDSLYVEIDPETLKTKRAMMNYAGFAASSPDHSKVAAFGPVPHFATEDQQSKYIVVDNSVIYPLPAGKRAEPLAPLAIYPKGRGGDTVEFKTGAVPTASGVHDIGTLVWSPDSARVAIIDTTFDLTPGMGTPKEIGPEGTNTRCHDKSALVVVDMDGRAQSFPLSVPGGQTPEISWKDAAHLDVRIKGAAKTYVVK
jgi:hypothetical protein